MSKHKKEYLHPKATVVELAQQNIMAGSITDNDDTVIMDDPEDYEDVEFD